MRLEDGAENEPAVYTASVDKYQIWRKETMTRGGVSPLNLWSQDNLPDRARIAAIKMPWDREAAWVRERVACEGQRCSGSAGAAFFVRRLRRWRIGRGCKGCGLDDAMSAAPFLRHSIQSPSLRVQPFYLGGWRGRSGVRIMRDREGRVESRPLDDKGATL